MTIPVEVAGRADAGTVEITLAVTMGGVEQLEGSTGEDLDGTGVGAIPGVLGRANDEVSEAIAVDVTTSGNAGAKAGTLSFTAEVKQRHLGRQPGQGNETKGSSQADEG